MEAIFNELSLDDLSGSVNDAREKMENLLQLCKVANDQLNCSRLRLPNADIFNSELVSGYTWNDWLNDGSVRRSIRDLFMGIKRFPFFDEVDDDIENEFIMSSFTLNEPQHPSHGQDANGLANAWLVRTLAVSFCSHSVWSKSKISLRIQNQQTVSNTVVIHTCSHKNIDTKLIQELQKVRRPPLRSRQEVDQWFPIAEGYFLSDKAKDDLIYWYEQNQHKTIEKINSFFKEIWESPFQGTGKVEPLSGDLSGWWPRRITDEHRLIYKVEGKKLFVCSCRGHYEALSCNT